MGLEGSKYKSAMHLALCANLASSTAFHHALAWPAPSYLPPHAAGHVRAGADERWAVHALVAGVVEAVARFMPHDPAQATVQAGDAVPARERGKRNQAAVAVHGGCRGGGLTSCRRKEATALQP